MKRTLYNDEHEAFRLAVRDFLAANVVPHYEQWENDGRPPREFYRAAGEFGLPGIQVPEEYGGGGVESFKFNCVFNEEVHRALVGVGSLRVQMDLVMPYFLRYATDEQKQRWLPGIAAGELLTAIAMTEPGSGSDLAGISTTAVRDGDSYIVNGAKTFISGGGEADLILTVVRTAPASEGDRRSGLSILVMESRFDGFSRGRNLEKIGLRAQDTSELFFDNVRVPVTNLLGEEGKGFEYLTHNLPQERLTIAVAAQAMAVAAVNTTVAYVRERTVFGKPLSSYQNTKFVLAECATEIEAGQALCDKAIEELDAGTLSVDDAAKVKLYLTEMQARVVDKCLQLHGGYGFMREYPIARMYTDARVSRIFGGTSEVMKTIISKGMGL